MRRFLLLTVVFAVLAGRAWGQQLYTGSTGVIASEVDSTYLAGMRFLQRTQAEEGNWPDEQHGTEPAITAFAVISILAHGDDPNFGPYAKTVHSGLDYILKQMDPVTGYIGPSMYNHGFSTLALAESYGAVDDPRLGTALQKAVRLIISAQEQNPRHAWRYSPEARDADTTVSGAQLVALMAARNARIPVPGAHHPERPAVFSLLVPDGRRRHRLHFAHFAQCHAHRHWMPGAVAGEGKEFRRVQGRLRLPEKRAAGFPISAIFSLLCVPGIFPRLPRGLAKLESPKHPIPARNTDARWKLGQPIWRDLRHRRLFIVPRAKLPLPPHLRNGKWFLWDQLKAAGGCRTPGRFARNVGHSNTRQRRGVRRPSAALLTGWLTFGLSFWATADAAQFDSRLVLQGNTVITPQNTRPAAEPKGDVMEFVDGSMLHGQLLQMDVNHGLAWENPNAKNPIYFKPGHIDFIRFASTDAVDQAPTCRLQFANGDDLFGSITTLDSDRLALSTWFGGTMTIPRPAIRSITFLSKNYAVLYEGPYDPSGWVFGIANMPQSWSYHDGWLTSQGTGCVGRELAMTNSSTIEFDLGWSGPLELEVQLYTDALERMENNNGSCVLQFTPTQILLSQARTIGSPAQLRHAALPDSDGKNRFHVTVQCNLAEGTLSVFINDVLIKVWKDETGFRAAGSGILFQQEGIAGGTVKLGNLRVSQWEGSYDPDTSRSISDTDSIHFVNHDRAAWKMFHRQSRTARWRWRLAARNWPFRCNGSRRSILPRPTP